MEKLDKPKNLFKSKKSILIITVAIVVLLIYAIFFLSKIFVPNGSNATPTPINTAKTFDTSREVAIMRWDYSPTQELMEVELNINNKTYDGIDTYKFQAGIRTYTQKDLPVEVVVEDPSFVVLHIENIPKNWQDVTLRMKVDDSNKPDVLRLYSTKESINYVDTIETKTKAEYLSDRVYSQVERYNEKLVELDNQYNDLTSKISALQTANAVLEDDKKYQTQEDISNSNKKIKDNKTQIEKYKEQQESIENQKEEYKNKIEKSKEKINSVQNAQN